MSDPTPPSPPQAAPRCIYLSCKSMLVYGENFENDPEYQAGMVEFWCNSTCAAHGPDGNDARMELCRNPERGCYREFLA